MAPHSRKPPEIQTNKTNVRLHKRAALAHLRDRLRCPWNHRPGTRYTGVDGAEFGTVASVPARPVIRPLLSYEAGAYLAHLIRLDPESRRLRFARPIDDRSLRNFVAAIDWSRALVLAHIEDGVVRGAAHLAWPDVEWLGGDGELAVAVEQSWRRRGMGRGLLERATGEARARGLAGIMFFTQADNAAMLAMADGLNAPLSYFGRDVEGRVALDVPPTARPLFYAGMAV